MKVILLQEIKGQGGEGDVVEVKRGYAVNYLFPQKLASPATRGNLKQLELRKHNITRREAERLNNADKMLATLTERVITIPARVGEEGHLFGSVTTQQIADKLGEELKIEIDRKKIDLQAPIKKAGEHSVTVTVYRDIKAVVTINVIDEVRLAKELAARAAEKIAEVVEEKATEEEAAEDEILKALTAEAKEAEETAEAEEAEEAV